MGGRGSGAVGALPKVLTLKAALYLPPHPSLRDTFSPRAKAFDGYANQLILHIVLLRPPKLVNLKFSNKLQTVSKQYQGWRGVAN